MWLIIILHPGNQGNYGNPGLALQYTKNKWVWLGVLCSFYTQLPLHVITHLYMLMLGAKKVSPAWPALLMARASMAIASAIARNKELTWEYIHNHSLS